MGKEVKKHGYSCKLVRVVDGDTCDAMIDLGFNVWVKNRIRFMGVDAWESRTRNKEEKVKGLTTYERRVKKVKEVAGDCWWLKNYLMDRCGLQKESKPRKARNE